MKTRRISAVCFCVLLVVSGSAYGDRNTFLGDYAGNECDTCADDTFIGYGAGEWNISTQNNTCVGVWAGAAGTAGEPNPTVHDNTCIGYYAGFAAYSGSQNTFVGSSAGYNTTVGNENTFIGYEAGYYNTNGNYNAFIGSEAGNRNTGGVENTLLGHKAGYWNQTGNLNILIGESAGLYNNGHWNVAIGAFAGQLNSTGSNNVFLGANAGSFEFGSNKLYIDNCIKKDGSGNCTIPLIYGDFAAQIVNINGTLTATGGIHFLDGTTQTSGLTGLSNANVTFLGQNAGRVTTGSDDTFIGNGAGYSNTSGYSNNFFGYHAGYFNTTGYVNSFFGVNAGFSNHGGNSNSFFGNGSGYSNQEGSYNTFVGTSAGSGNETGSYNCFVGTWAGTNNKSDSNSFLGYQAGYSNITGHGNVFLGYNAGYSETGSNKLYIDNCVGGAPCTSPLIYGDFSSNSRLVQINGQLIMSSGSSLSDMRLKKNIAPLRSSLDKVMHLQGVSYEWKEDERAARGFTKDRQIGLIAQDVEAVIPELVQADNKGYKSLSYDKVVPVLIEAIKEQQVLIKDLQGKNVRLEQRLLALEAK